MTEIAYDGDGQLHVTDIETARTMDKSSFDTVVTVCQEPIRDNVSADTSYCWYNMSDGDSGYGGISAWWLFELAADRVYDCLTDGETVLVHCHKGRSRSVSVGGAALACITDRYVLTEIQRILSARGVGKFPKDILLRHAHRYWMQNA